MYILAIVPLKKRPDALLALTGEFKKEFPSLSTSESDCFLYIAEYPGCTTPCLTRAAKLVEKSYIRRLNNPKRSRQKIYFLTANKGMHLLNTWVDRTCIDLISGPNLGLARIALALEENSSLSTLVSLENLLKNMIKNHQCNNMNNIIANHSNSKIQNSNQKV